MNVLSLAGTEASSLAFTTELPRAARSGYTFLP
jgi:hypothetical protein